MKTTLPSRSLVIKEKLDNGLLSKLAYAEGFEGDAEPRPAAYSNVREDSSTASTYKSPAEVEFRKKSNIVKEILDVGKSKIAMIILFGSYARGDWV